RRPQPAVIPAGGCGANGHAMSIQVIVKVTGNPRAYKALADKIEERLDDVLMQGAFEGERIAKQRMGRSPSLPGAPPGVVTGTLRAGIQAKTKGKLRKEIRSSAHYSIYLEYGTSRMAARPFMRPMARQLRQQLPRMLRGIGGKWYVAGGR
ncbi:MAG: HK97 gp10 family phage protein, partial [Anaerolineae bacterium]|nr:HK97 gp10 family phage protein [Anaerolineae bacterium]